MAPPALTSWQNAAIAAIGLVWFVAAGKVYAQAWMRLRREGGTVQAGSFALSDVLVSLVLAGLFCGLLIKAALRREEETMSVRDVLPSALAFATFVAGLIGFLKYRRFSLSDLFGWRRLSFAATAGWAALLLLSAFPFVAAVNAITVLILKDDAQEQALVELFRAAAQRGDFPVLAAIGFAGVIVAPICEEFLFRGYFYGVGKHYLGAWSSGLLTAVLFAVFHGSLTALPGLFLLAVALTLAYERTGSLAVPMTMHALFNSVSLGVMYLQATDRLSI